VDGRRLEHFAKGKLRWVPHISILSVRSHDILYTLFREILYTSARA
jgi:hypothetical protein